MKCYSYSGSLLHRNIILPAATYRTQHEITVPNSTYYRWSSSIFITKTCDDVQPHCFIVTYFCIFILQRRGFTIAVTVPYPSTKINILLDPIWLIAKRSQVTKNCFITNISIYQYTNTTLTLTTLAFFLVHYLSLYYWSLF